MSNLAPAAVSSTVGRRPIVSITTFGLRLTLSPETY